MLTPEQRDELKAALSISVQAVIDLDSATPSHLKILTLPACPKCGAVIDVWNLGRKKLSEGIEKIQVQLETKLSARAGQAMRAMLAHLEECPIQQRIDKARHAHNN